MRNTSVKIVISIFCSLARQNLSLQQVENTSSDLSILLSKLASSFFFKRSYRNEFCLATSAYII